MQIRIYILFLTFVLASVGCRNNEDISDNVDIEYPTEVFITTSVKGTVKSKKNSAITGAVVSIGSISKTSDFNGYFQFENVSARKSGEIIKVEKPGFLTTYKTVYPQKDAVIYIDIELKSESTPIVINSNDPDKVFNNENDQASIKGNDFTRGGNVFSGQLTVKPFWSMISDEDFYDRQIGDPIGYDRYYNTKGISSYGIVGIDILDNDDQKIELGKGTYIEIKINSTSHVNPDELSVWKFNFEKNKWLETDLKAKLITQSNKSFYVSEVESTGIYNFGTNFNVYEKEMNVLTHEGLQAQFIDVDINSENLNFKLSKRTSDKGKIIAYIPLDENSDISIVLDKKPFKQTILKDEDIINIPADQKLITVQGNMFDCNGNALKEGYITIISNNDTIFYNVDESGRFNCNILDAKNEDKIIWIASDTKNEINSLIHHAGKANIIDLDDIYMCQESFAFVEFGEEKYLLDLNMNDITSSTLALEFKKDGVSLELGSLNFKGEDTYDLNSFFFTFLYNQSATKRLFPDGAFDIKVIEYNKPGMIRGRLEGMAHKNFDDMTVRKLKIIYSVKLE